MMENSSARNGKKNGKDFWCPFEMLCSYSCVVDDAKLLPQYPPSEQMEKVQKKFEKCLDKFTFSEVTITPESKPFTKTEILAVKQLCMYELRLKLKNRGVPIVIPPILLQQIEKMKSNKPLLVALSHYKDSRKVLKSLKFI